MLLKERCVCVYYIFNANAWQTARFAISRFMFKVFAATQFGLIYEFMLWPGILIVNPKRPIWQRAKDRYQSLLCVYMWLLFVSVDIWVHNNTRSITVLSVKLKILFNKNWEHLLSTITFSIGIIETHFIIVSVAFMTEEK